MTFSFHPWVLLFLDSDLLKSVLLHYLFGPRRLTIMEHLLELPFFLPHHEQLSSCGIWTTLTPCLCQCSQESNRPRPQLTLLMFICGVSKLRHVNHSRCHISKLECCGKIRIEIRAGDPWVPYRKLRDRESIIRDTKKHSGWSCFTFPMQLFTPKSQEPHLEREISSGPSGFQMPTALARSSGCYIALTSSIHMSLKVLWTVISGSKKLNRNCCVEKPF